MRPVSPYRVLNLIFGGGKQRRELGYIEDLHWLSSGWIPSTDSSSSNLFSAFEASFYAHVSKELHRKEKCIFLWCQWMIDRVAVHADLESVLSLMLRHAPEDVHDVIRQHVPALLEWYQKPADFLDKYFAEKEKNKLSVEEFLEYVGAKTKEEIELATEAFNMPLEF